MGFPYFRRLLTGDKIELFTAIAFVGVGVAISALSVIAAVSGQTSLGVTPEPPGGVVRQVEPGSFGWRAGIRSGQTVVRIESSENSVGGAITTAGTSFEIRASSAAAEQAVRETLPFALLATGLAGLAVVSVVWNARRAGALAAIAVIVGGVPLSVASTAPVAVTAAIAALAVPSFWLIKHAAIAGGERPSAPAALLLGASWVAAWAAVPAAFDALEVTRTGTVVLAGGAIVGFQVDRRAVAERIRSFGGLRTIDVATLAISIVLVLELVLVAGAPLIVVGAIVGIELVLYPRWRRLAGGAIDRWLVADLRDRLSLEASEAERGRLARDLHDVPLQGLAGVILRLDRVPEAREENVALREVAAELRAIATELRPPILDDLGLSAAIGSLITSTSRLSEGFEIANEVRDKTNAGAAGRPPAAVEIAAYRIVQEALANAIRHSGGHRVAVEGVVDAHRITVTIRDDGTGLSRNALERATREGRLGVHSMKQRAQSVGADLSFGTAPEGGLEVRVQWTG